MKATKNYLLKLSLLVCVLFSFMAITVSAKTVTYTTPDGLFDYSLTSSKTAVITAYHGLTTNLKISSTVKSPNGKVKYPVVSIGNGSSPVLSGSDVKTVTLPSSVVRIATNAFRDYTYLQKITLGDGVKSIGDSAFQGCTALAEVEIPSSCALAEIGDSAFYGCKLIKKFDAGLQLDSIGESAFMNCKGLTHVVLGPKLYGIGESAFRGCTSLVNVTDGVDHSADPERYGDPASPITYDNYLPASMEYLGAYAFYGTPLRGHLVIPAKITDIQEGTFQNCKNLKSVYLTNGVESIGSKAFRNCTSLSFLFAPRSVIEVADNAFSGASIDDSRTSVYLFKKSFFDDFLNSTKQFNAGMFNYLQASTVPADTTIRLTAPDAADPLHPVMWAGQNMKIQLEYVDSHGTPIPALTKEIGENITWKTNHPETVFFVKKNQDSANITSIKAGVGYVIKATLNNQVDGDITVKVNAAPKSVTLMKKGASKAAPQYSVDLMKATSLQLKAVTAPVDGADAEWSSSNTDVATVDQKGLVKWNGKEGTTLITATTYNGKKSSVLVSFQYHFKTDAKKFVKGETLVIEAGAGPIAISADPLGFASTTKITVSDPTVLTLDKTHGTVTPLKAGVVKLTGKDISGKVGDAKTAYDFTCTIIVTPKKQVIDPASYKKLTTGYYLKWKRVVASNGYKIAVKAPGTSKYKVLNVKRGPKQNAYTFSDFVKGQTYQIKVCSFILYNGKEYCGEWSEPYTLKAK